MRILLTLLLSGFAALGAVTGAVQNDSTTKHVTQPSGFWAAQPGDSTFVGAVRASQTNRVGGGGGAVSSVNGQAGVVVLSTSDISEDANLYWNTTRSNNLTVALWQFAVAYFYALSNPSNFVIASAGQVTNNVNSDIAVVRSLAANGNATFANHGNAGSPLTVDEFTGTNALAQFYNTVNGRQVIMSSNADITIGAGKFSGDGSLLTNVSLPTITLSGDATGIGTTAITVVGVNAKNSTNFWGLLSGTNLPALTGDITSSAGSAATTLKTSPTIVTPTIASFANSTHNHQNAAGGGTLDAAAIASGAFVAARQGSITNHSDVTVNGTAPTPGDVFRWSGTAWTNGPPTGYTIDLFDVGNNSMVANTSYYYGKMSSRLINTVYGIAAIDVPKAGTIKRVQYKYDVAGTLATGELVSFFIEVNNSTDVLQFSCAMTNTWTNTVVTGSQAVSVGDTLVLKVTTPSTWATPATSARLVAQVYIE